MRKPPLQALETATYEAWRDFGGAELFAEVPWLSVLAGDVIAALAGRPPAHDASHVLRVVGLARTIAHGESESGDLDVVTAAALLHEQVNLPKDHPRSRDSGDLCADAARALVLERGGAPSFAEAVATAIREHAFSRGRTPTTPESRILQDADRLDAIGAVGIARCFGTSTEMKRPFFGPEDPACETRTPDDKAFALDHFFTKLLLLPSRLHTETAKKLAEPRARFLQRFVAEAARELAESRAGTALDRTAVRP